MFTPGQLVECINDEPDAFVWRGNKDLHGLRRGNIYTVQEAYVSEWFKIRCITLAEIVRPEQSPPEPGFDVRRFRPVQCSRLDVFRHMLAPTHGDLAYQAVKDALRELIDR